MANFVYNRYSKEENYSQWRRHLQNEAYIGDITKSIKDSGSLSSAIISQKINDVNDTIKYASKEQVAAIRQSTNAICGTLENGFGMLHDDLHDISYEISGLSSEISSMSSMLDWKLSLLVEQQKITNLLSGNIAVLLGIAEIEKERQHYVKEGIKAFHNARFEPELFEKSLNNFKNAVNKESTDYFALHKIGLIYMFSPNHENLSEAEKYFKEAAKWAVAETHAGSILSTNYLKGDVTKNLLEQSPTVDSIKLQAAEAYLYASKCCYFQSKISEAIDYANKAFQLVPEFLEAGFTLSKALAANNDEVQAASVLEKVINKDRYYSLTTIDDLDLCPKPAIQSLLTKLEKEATQKAFNLLRICKQKMIDGSKATDQIIKIENLVNQNTYLTSKKAFDLLKRKVQYSFEEAISKDSSGKWKSTIEPMTFSFSIEELIDYENQLIDYEKKAIHDAKAILQECKEIMQPNSPAKATLDEVEIHISKNSFLSGSYALELLNTEYKWTYFSIIARVPNINSITKKAISSQLKIIDFIKAENKNLIDLKTKTSELKEELIKKRKEDANEYLINSIKIGTLFGGFIGWPSGCLRAMDTGPRFHQIFFETIFYSALIGLLIGVVIGISHTKLSTDIEIYEDKELKNVR